MFNFESNLYQGADRMNCNDKNPNHIQNNCSQNGDTKKENTDNLRSQLDDPKIESAAREILERHMKAFKELTR